MRCKCRQRTLDGILEAYSDLTPLTPERVDCLAWLVKVI